MLGEEGHGLRTPLEGEGREVYGADASVRAEGLLGGDGVSRALSSWVGEAWG